jgi:anti-sigma factor RsiW
MRCSSSRRLFEDLIDGSLAARTHAAVESHLERCPECAALLEELRVVDALLLCPPAVELPANFTQRTMAEARALRAPCPARPRVFLFLGVYLVLSWLGIASALLFAGPQTRALLNAILAGATVELAAVGGFVHAALRGFGPAVSGLTELSAGALALDVLVAGVLAYGYFVVRPRLLARDARSESTP